MHIRIHYGLLLAFFRFKVTAHAMNPNNELHLRSGETIPSPLSIPPSQYFDGDDGSWSSLAIRVGEPAQNVRVLVSTNSPQTLLVLPLGCTDEAISPLPSDCANARGGLFSTNQSSTWDDQGDFGINGGGIGFEANLGYTQYADFGLDAIGLGYVEGSNGPTLEKQTIGAIATSSPFYTGIFGLGTQPVNFSTIGNYSSPSYFSSLWSQKLIPGMSWSYTAGASYRFSAGQYAQLIFGGYDSSRFTPNSANFPLAGDIDRDIVVAIQSITYSGTTQKSLLSSPTYAFIESTDPNLWLPEAACEAFEDTFGLSLDAESGLYLMNSTQYASLKATNPQVTFSLASGLTGGEYATIVLPFSAFALPAKYPFVSNSTYYFPLRKSANDTQNTLGRAFLQEAYLTVDYERGNFSVSQCTWNEGASSKLNSIISPTLFTNSSTTTIPSVASSASKSQKHLSIGIIIAIIIIVILLMIVSVFAGCYIYRRRKKLRPTSTSKLTLQDAQKDGPSETGSYMEHTQPHDITFHEAPGPEYTRGSMIPVEVYGSGFDKHSNILKSVEIYSSTSNNPDEYYATAARRMEYQRTTTLMPPEMSGIPLSHELAGCESAVEMDDESSRHAFSSTSSLTSPALQQQSFQEGSSATSISNISSMRSPNPSEWSYPFDLTLSKQNPITSRPQSIRNTYFSSSKRTSMQRSGSKLSHYTKFSDRDSISPSEPGTPLDAMSPTIGRPPSMFLRSYNNTSVMPITRLGKGPTSSPIARDSSICEVERTQATTSPWLF